MLWLWFYDTQLKTALTSIKAKQSRSLLLLQICKQRSSPNRSVHFFHRLASGSPSNPEFGHFTLLFCKGRLRNLLRTIPHVQSRCLLNSFIYGKGPCMFLDETIRTSFVLEFVLLRGDKRAFCVFSCNRASPGWWWVVVLPYISKIGMCVPRGYGL